VVSWDTEEVFWFLNESFAARTERGKAYIWTPVPGEFVLRAIDENGRSASARFRVIVSE
jgi:penicillin-binding protein 1C